MRLVSWAVPILTERQPLPLTIICGGVLLSKPDAALRSFARDVAPRHGVESSVLIESFDSVPVMSRSHLRAAAELVFQLTNTFIAQAVQRDFGERRLERPIVPEPRQSLVFPPVKAQQTQKARAHRTRKLAQQSSEAEVVRLLRQREPERACAELTAALRRDEDVKVPDATIATSLRAVEIFSRLLRELVGHTNTPRMVNEKFSRLTADVLSWREPEKSPDDLKLACKEFIAIAEDLIKIRRSRKIRTVENYVGRNLAKKLTLGAVSARFGITERELDSWIRKYYGMSFAEYVSMLRVAEAKRLLEDSGLTIGEIASRTGFKDQSYLTKVVKSRLGLTPSELRDMRA